MIPNTNQPTPPKVNPVLEAAAVLGTQPAMEGDRFHQLKRTKLKGKQKQRLAFSHAGEEHAQVHILHSTIPLCYSVLGLLTENTIVI